MSCPPNAIVLTVTGEIPPVIAFKSLVEVNVPLKLNVLILFPSTPFVTKYETSIRDGDSNFIP
jgi:hypothetical protein